MYTLTKIWYKNLFVIKRRYCPFLDVFVEKITEMDWQKTISIVTFSVHFDIFSHFFEKKVHQKSIGFQFDEIVFCVHEGPGLKT